MLSKKSFIILSPIIFITCLTIKAQALEYSSYIFTIRDIIFFSYKNGTFIEIYDSSDTLIWDNDGNTLDKGKHVRVPYPEVLPRANEVYKVCGSKKFAVLTGDPAVEGRGVSGYYAMDANGLGTCKELYTYVPVLYDDPCYVGHQFFIVFAYQDNTQVTVQRDVGNGDYENVAPTFTLNKGKHWANSEISNKYLHIIADKPVSALTCHDQSYFAPSAGGRWSGTEFYTYLNGIVDPTNAWPDGQKPSPAAPARV